MGSFGRATCTVANYLLEIGASNTVSDFDFTKGQLRAYFCNIDTVAKGQGSKAATVVTSQDLVQPLVAVSVQSAQLRQKLQSVHDEYQKKQLHLVRQLAASTTTASSSVQGGYNCGVLCFESDSHIRVSGFRSQTFFWL